MSNLNSETLTRYFAGQDAGAGSNYDADVAAVLAVGQVSVDCRTCSGRGFRELTEAELRTFAASIADQKTVEHRDQVRRALSRASDCPTCKGSGKVTARRGDRAAAMDSMYTTVCCGQCRGCGETTNPTDTSAERGDVCLGCGGDAYIVPVTVRSKGSSNQGGAGGSSATDGDAAPLLLSMASSEPAAEHDHHLTDRHRVAAELEAVRTRDPQLAAGLASYHGPEADAWVDHRWGRGFVLWQHTDAGKQIAEHVAAHSPARSGYLVAATERLAGARAAAERPPAGRPTQDTTLLRVLVARADREARELKRRVLAAANDVENAA